MGDWTGSRLTVDDSRTGNEKGTHVGAGYNFRQEFPGLAVICRLFFTSFAVCFGLCPTLRIQCLLLLLW